MYFFILILPTFFKFTALWWVHYLKKDLARAAQCLAGNSNGINRDWGRKEIHKPKKLYWMQNIFLANFFKMNSFFINAKMKNCKIALMQQMHWCCNIGPEPLWSCRFRKPKTFDVLRQVMLSFQCVDKTSDTLDVSCYQ